MQLTLTEVFYIEQGAQSMALRARAVDLERTYTPEEFEALPEFDELFGNI